MDSEGEYTNSFTGVFEALEPIRKSSRVLPPFHKYSDKSLFPSVSKRTLKLIAGTPFFFEWFPDQEPCVRGFTMRCDGRIAS